eukprot:UN24167
MHSMQKKFKSEQTKNTHLETKKHKENVKKSKIEDEDKIITCRILNKNDNSINIKKTENNITVFPLKTIPLNSCLFCPKKLENLSGCLEHMLVHGFHIPHIEYVTSVKGLLLHLGKTIGDLGICMWCEKSFTTLEGLWEHMNVKGHRQLFLSEEESPIDQFYDFTKTQGSESSFNSKESGNTVSTVATQKGHRHPIGTNKFGEIVLNDGTTIGNRHNRITDN